MLSNFISGTFLSATPPGYKMFPVHAKKYFVWRGCGSAVSAFELCKIVSNDR